MRHVYTPDGLGNFRKSTLDFNDSSINSIGRTLGYKDYEFYTWYAKDYQNNICFKLFSKDIIFIDLREDLGYSLSASLIDQILRDNDYSYEKAFDTYTRESALSEGIEGKYLTDEFMSEATHTTLIGNVLVDKLNGYTYFFENGILVRYVSNDGLLGSSRDLKGTGIFRVVKANAEKYYSKYQEIIDEINRQFDYADSIPGDQLDKIREPRYNFNYGLLYIDAVHPAISIEDFKRITHYDYVITRRNIKNTEILHQGVYYCFDEYDRLTTKEYKEISEKQPTLKKVSLRSREVYLDSVYDVNDSVKSICIELPSGGGITKLFINDCECLLDRTKKRISFIIYKDGNYVRAEDTTDKHLYFSTENEAMQRLVSMGNKFLGQVRELKMSPDHKNYYVEIVFAKL